MERKKAPQQGVFFLLLLNELKPNRVFMHRI